MADANKLLTVRQIADALGVPKSKVMYMLRTEGITPTARASQTLLFLPSVVSVLQRALEKQIPQPRVSKPCPSWPNNDSFAPSRDTIAIARQLLAKEVPSLEAPGSQQSIDLHAEYASNSAMVKIINLDESVRQEFGFYPLFAGYIRDYAKEIKP